MKDKQRQAEQERINGVEYAYNDATSRALVTLAKISGFAALASLIVVCVAVVWTYDIAKRGYLP